MSRVGRPASRRIRSIAPTLSSFTMGESYDQKDAAGIHQDSGAARSRSRARMQDESRRGCEVKMWSGRFRQPLDPEFERWQRSFPFRPALAGARVGRQPRPRPRFAGAGVLSSSELIAVLDGLEQIARPRPLRPQFLDDEEAEDIHHFVEKRLVALIGETGYKLHSGRSRNEQIATDLRLYVRAERSTNCSAGMAEWLGVACGRAQSRRATRPCRHTPICSAPSRCWWRTGCWPMARCFCATPTGSADCRKRLNVCPLGSGAVAGATLSLDRRAMAAELGFRRSHGKQHRCHQRPRLRFGVCQRAFPVGAAPKPLGRRDDFVFIRRSTASCNCRRLTRPASSAMPQKKNPDAWN